MAAVRSSHASVVSLLFSRYTYNRFGGQTMLFAAKEAAQQDNRGMFEIFLEKGGSDIGCRQSVPKAVIQVAARNGWDDLLQCIYDEGHFDNELFD